MGQIQDLATKANIPIDMVHARAAELAVRFGVTARKAQLAALLETKFEKTAPIGEDGKPEPYIMQIDQNVYRSDRIYKVFGGCRCWGSLCKQTTSMHDFVGCSSENSLGNRPYTMLDCEGQSWPKLCKSLKLELTSFLGRRI